MSRPSASGRPGASGIDGTPHHFLRLWEASGEQLLFGECSHFSAHPTPTLLPRLPSTILEPHAATWRQVSQPSALGSQLIQPIPWRKPNVPEPVMSKPITKEQRPEREAMKRKAQLERENAAKYTSLGKVQYFIEREKEMEIARYYGYAI